MESSQNEKNQQMFEKVIALEGIMRRWKSTNWQERLRLVQQCPDINWSNLNTIERKSIKKNTVNSNKLEKWMQRNRTMRLQDKGRCLDAWMNKLPTAFKDNVGFNDSMYMIIKQKQEDINSNKIIEKIFASSQWI